MDILTLTVLCLTILSVAGLLVFGFRREKAQISGYIDQKDFQGLVARVDRLDSKIDGFKNTITDSVDMMDKLSKRWNKRERDENPAPNVKGNHQPIGRDDLFNLRQRAALTR